MYATLDCKPHEMIKNLYKPYNRSGLQPTKHDTRLQGLREKLYLGVRRSKLGPLASRFLVETCIACFYNNYNIDKTATMPRFRNILSVILATTMYTRKFGLDYRKT